ncbi:hypothetical protein DPMN_173120 [Dreissena polymorpha]|uniref:B box-type domain-containing protein n=2 Tax=Dreissena polymorpha TaxID=45954 RepID=A0A9D4E3L9_DREPO|nr:hypothetical protein DPMN_173120 [Dreissena polymorpha]
MKWPLSKQMENSLITCDIHKNDTLTMLCNDHSQLCCSKCVKLSYSLCFQVTTLHQAAKTRSTDFNYLSVRTQNTLSQMEKFQTYQQDKIKSLQVLYNEHEKLMVARMRVNISCFLLQCENNTMNETHEHVQYTVNEIRGKIKSMLADFEKSTVNEKKRDLRLQKAPLICMRNSCTRLHNELFHLHVAIKKVHVRPELFFIARKKCQEKIKESDTFLKESFANQVFLVNGKSDYSVNMPSDLHTCRITAICVIPNGQVVVADLDNRKVKLLNQQNEVVNHWTAGGSPLDMCQITPSEVVVAVDDNNIHEVQFITVKTRQLLPGRKFQLQHRCIGIANHQRFLFVTSGSTLYKYSLGGKLVSKVYENTSGDETVKRCAVSPDGDKLYITDPWQDTLLTLARDGQVLAIFKDPELCGPQGVNVTPAGQVLLCGYVSHNIMQVDNKGMKNLSTLATRERDGVELPWSVCYNSITSTMIVGLYKSNNILVFKVE